MLVKKVNIISHFSVTALYVTYDVSYKTLHLERIVVVKMTFEDHSR